MNHSLILLYLILCVVVKNQTAPIAIDFNRFEATFYQDQKLKLSFFCTGGNGNYTFLFRNIPNDWKVQANSIIIQKFSISVRQNWRFSVNVTDSANNYLSQSLLLNFMGAYVGLSSVTLPVTGNLQENSIKNNGFNAIQISKIQQNTSLNNLTSAKSVQKSAGQSDQEPRLVDLVNDYPGMDPLERFTVGFGLSNNSPITADLIATSKAVYNPLRDSYSSPYKSQKQAAVRRQAQANQTVSGLLELKDKINATVQKLKQDAIIVQSTLNSTKALVNDCDKQLLRLQDLKKKVGNAISDKESMVNQYTLQIIQVDKKVEGEVQKLAVLQQMKKKSQSQYLPNSRALQNLQKTLDECRKNTVQNSKVAEQNKLQIQKIQSQIRMLNIESNEAKVKTIKITDDLKDIRQKIISLQNQLKQAKTYEDNILKQKTRLEQIPATNDIRVLTLQSQINSINSKLGNAEDNCRVYEAPISSIQSIINKDREKYNNIINEIKDQTVVVNRVKNESMELKKNSNTLPLQLSTLKKQASSYDELINRTSYLCDGRITQYSKAAIAYKNSNDKIASSQSQLSKISSQLASAQSQQKAANDILSGIMRVESNYFNSLSNSSVSNKYQLPNIAPKSVQRPTQNPLPPITQSNTIVSNSSTNLAELSVDQIIKLATKQSGIQQKSDVPSNGGAFVIQPGISRQNLGTNAVRQSQTNSSQFSISSYLSKPSENVPLSTNILPQSIKQTTKSQFITKPITPNLLSQDPNTILSDQFKASGVNGSKAVMVADVRQFLKKINIDLSNATISQTSYLYTLNQQSIRNLTSRGASQFKLPPSSCSKSTVSGSATVKDVGIGYILAGDNDMLFRLTLTQCTKIMSTQKGSYLKQGTKIYFAGTPVVSLPKNTLLNANYIVCIPGPA